jgi:hypothetical protein
MDRYYTVVEQHTQDKYLVLKKDYFTFNVGKIKGIKCDYECRNYIMYDLKRPMLEIYYKNMIDCEFEGDLELRNGIFYNRKTPYMIFTNEYVDDMNSVMESYDQIDIDKMIHIIHQKKCHQDFFIIYEGDEKYISCSIHTRHLNHFDEVYKDMIVEQLYEDPNVVVEFTERNPPVVRTVEENKKYRMRMPEDSFSIFNDQLIGTMYGDDLIVEFVLKSGKAFIVHDGKYLTEHGTFVSEMPEEGFDIYENGVGFRDKIMDIEWYKASYGEVVFNKSGDVDVFFEDF